MEDLISLLYNGHHSLVVANGEVCTFNGRGISDLYVLLTNNPGFLREASVADKVVGKGAAALMVLGGVQEVYAGVISTPALNLFHKSGITVRFGQEVPNIINRTDDGICPVEQLCTDYATAAECLPVIRKFLGRNYL